MMGGWLPFVIPCPGNSRLGPDADWPTARSNAAIDLVGAGGGVRPSLSCAVPPP